ncbi:hypothetical protein PRZ48_002472 [Zasmidium cellare]|uniref:Polyadenylation factor subunit 2 n=1 Tax=Zasmidium cellare TaxID=395010 RepID=A0ABR0F797_ZASCE|nr:hypothetical protein PRZ48_002472 [Zasmidium cellare]
MATLLTKMFSALTTLTYPFDVSDDTLDKATIVIWLAVVAEIVIGYYIFRGHLLVPRRELAAIEADLTASEALVDEMLEDRAEQTNNTESETPASDEDDTIAEVNDTLDNLQVDLARTEEELQVSRGELEDARGQIESKEAEVADLIATNNHQEQDFAKLKHENSEQRAEIQALKVQLDQANAVLEKSQKDLTTAKGTARAPERTSKQLKQSKQSTKEATVTENEARLMRELERAREELRAERKRSAALGMENAYLKDSRQGRQQVQTQTQAQAQVQAQAKTTGKEQEAEKSEQTEAKSHGQTELSSEAVDEEKTELKSEGASEEKDENISEEMSEGKNDVANSGAESDDQDESSEEELTVTCSTETTEAQTVTDAGTHVATTAIDPQESHEEDKPAASVDTVVIKSLEEISAQESKEVNNHQPNFTPEQAPQESRPSDMTLAPGQIELTPEPQREQNATAADVNTVAENTHEPPAHAIEGSTHPEATTTGERALEESSSPKKRVHFEENASLPPTAVETNTPSQAIGAAVEESLAEILAQESRTQEPDPAPEPQDETVQETISSAQQAPQPSNVVEEVSQPTTDVLTPSSLDQPTQASQPAVVDTSTQEMDVDVSSADEPAPGAPGASTQPVPQAGDQNGSQNMSAQDDDAMDESSDVSDTNSLFHDAGNDQDTEMPDKKNVSEPVTNQATSTGGQAAPDLVFAPTNPDRVVEMTDCEPEQGQATQQSTQDVPPPKPVETPEFEMTDDEATASQQASSSPQASSSQQTQEPKKRFKPQYPPKEYVQSLIQQVTKNKPVQMPAQTPPAKQNPMPVRDAKRKAVLPPNATASVVCKRCGKPEIANEMLGLCKDCSAAKMPNAPGLIAGLESVSTVQELPFESETRPGGKHARIEEPSDDDEPLADQDDMEVDMEVDIKKLDGPKDLSGFNGEDKHLRGYHVPADRDDDQLKFFPSEVNRPLHYLERADSRTLIKQWLLQSLDDLCRLQSEVKKPALGPDFIRYRLPLIATRLQHIIDYGIQENRWRRDRIDDSDVKPFRDVAKKYHMECINLLNRINRWLQTNTDGQSPPIDVFATDTLRKIKELAAIIENAARPIPRPSARKPTIFSPRQPPSGPGPAQTRPQGQGPVGGIILCLPRGNGSANTNGTQSPSTNSTTTQQAPTNNTPSVQPPQVQPTSSNSAPTEQAPANNTPNVQQGQPNSTNSGTTPQPATNNTSSQTKQLPELLPPCDPTRLGPLPQVSDEEKAKIMQELADDWARPHSIAPQMQHDPRRYELVLRRRQRDAVPRNSDRWEYLNRHVQNLKAEIMHGIPPRPYVFPPPRR